MKKTRNITLLSLFVYLSNDFIEVLNEVCGNYQHVQFVNYNLQ